MAGFGRGKHKPEGDRPPKAGCSYGDAVALAAGPVRMHQLAFGDRVVGDVRWDLDFGRGLITFGDVAYPIQFIGSESHRDGTWMWGSENINGFSDDILTDVRAFVHRAARDWPEIAGPTLELDELVTGHNLSSLVAYCCGEPSCYYRCPYDGGAAFVLVKNLPDAVFRPADALGAVSLLGELVAHLPLDHRCMAEGLLHACCDRVERAEEALVGHFPGGHRVTVTFDGLGRIAKMANS